MSKILVYLQQQNGKLLKSSLSALTAAKEIASINSAQLCGICFGGLAKTAAEDAIGYGISEVFYSENSVFEKFLPSVFAKAISATSKDINAAFLVAAASSQTKDFFPIAACLLDAGQASEVLQINPDSSFRRPMYAGNAIADVQVTTAVKVLTVRATSFAASEKASAGGKITEIVSVPENDAKSEVISYEISQQERPELSDAGVVVSGGRALASTENFEKYIYPLADVLGAAVGASRAAVDAGYVPNDWQVGQTGKVVAPNLYIAVGISGAIQHLAGMKDSKVIVAINKDPEAPIFEVADYGLVADLFEALPALTEKIKANK